MRRPLHPGGFPGWESYLPLIAPNRSLGALLPSAILFAVDPPALAAEAEHHAARLAADCAVAADHGRPAPPPDALELPAAEVRQLLDRASLRLSDLHLPGLPGGENVPSAPPVVDFQAAATDLFHGQLPRFPQEVATARARGERCLVVTPAAHRRRIEELLEGREIQLGRGGVELVSGELAMLHAFDAALYRSMSVCSKPLSLL